VPTALITIDVQADTLDGQPLEIAGTSAALPQMASLCSGFRAAGRPIVHVMRLYLADGSNAEPSRQALVRGPVPVLRPGTPGRTIAPELLPAGAPALDDDLLLSGSIQKLGPDEVVIYKPRWGAFFRTPLDDHLRALGVTTLVFAGCNFPNCPRTSIYEASERDYAVVLADDAISGLYDRGRQELTGIGVECLPTRTILARLD
jgi:nicotinamidase-related amidase